MKLLESFVEEFGFSLSDTFLQCHVPQRMTKHCLLSWSAYFLNKIQVLTVLLFYLIQQLDQLKR